MKVFARRCGCGLVLLVSGLLALSVAGVAAPGGYAPREQWEAAFRLTADAAYDVALDAQGNAFVGGTSGVVKYSAGGDQVWFSVTSTPVHALAVARSGWIVAATDSGLTAFDADGKAQWRAEQGIALSAVALTGTDSIVALAADGRILRLDAEGHRLSETKGLAGARAFAIEGDAVLLVVGSDLVCMDGETEVWRYAARHTLTAVAITPDGDVVAAGGQWVVRLSPDGQPRWESLFPGNALGISAFDAISSGNPAWGDREDVVVVGSIEGGKRMAYLTVRFDATGERIWEAVHESGLGGDAAYAAAIAPDGGILVTGMSWTPGTLPAKADSVSAYGTVRYSLALVETSIQRDAPVAALAAMPERPTTQDVVYFEDRSRDDNGDVVSSFWSLGDGTSTDGAPLPHWYKNPGTYAVALTVVDEHGLAETAVVQLEVFKAPVVDFVWTPPSPTDVDHVPFQLSATGFPANIVAVAWDFGDGDHEAQDPLAGGITHQFPDEGDYVVAVYVRDSWGVASHCRKVVPILNAPPIAQFAVTFEQPSDLIPSCDALFQAGEAEGFVCAAPAIPWNTGVVHFDDLSVDGEPWLALVGRVWNLGDGTTDTDPNPSRLYATGGEGWPILARGLIPTQLTVWDDDGASTTGHRTVTLANIAPYAAFSWWTWSGYSTLACSGGTPTATGTRGVVTVTRQITSWGEGSAVFGPGNGGSVALTLEGSGLVSVSETVPAGWSISYWSEDLAVDGETLHGTIDLGEGGSAVVYYDLYTPNGETLVPGTFYITGQFVSGADSLSLDSDVVLCMTVEMNATISLHAYGVEDTGYIDPNGDAVAFEWAFGPFGASAEQSPTVSVAATRDITYAEGQWVWQIDVPVTLRVTDGIDGTSVFQVIHLTGTWPGWAPS